MVYGADNILSYSSVPLVCCSPSCVMLLFYLPTANFIFCLYLLCWACLRPVFSYSSYSSRLTSVGGHLWRRGLGLLFTYFRHALFVAAAYSARAYFLLRTTRACRRAKQRHGARAARAEEGRRSSAAAAPS